MRGRWCTSRVLVGAAKDDILSRKIGRASWPLAMAAIAMEKLDSICCAFYDEGDEVFSRSRAGLVAPWYIIFYK
jgi:hypothetical protein